MALWFQNYLQNRKQAVVIKGKKSEYKTVPSGVSHEKLYYDGIEMEVVNKYRYLGFAFTTTLGVKQGIDHLVAKGKKAVFSLCTSFQICREMTKETFFKIFD